MRITKIIILLLSVIFLIFPLIASAEEDDNDVFKYKKLIYNEFALKAGSVIPVTIWQSIETDGNLTADGKYLFFASNREKGNFDIFLRSMQNITTVRLTSHSSKDTNPAISPDGKYLAFVSQRDDPEGDIFIMKIDSGDIIEKAEKSVSGISPQDQTAQNLTLYQDPESGTIRIIKDASPCWSPDGKHIAFSSARDGSENIWLMDRKGKDPVRLTEDGGSYPHFSNDGKKLIYISYRDKGGNGNIYIMDIETKKETRITDTSAIELNPVFLGNNNEIAYTLIEKDTNNDGRIDLRDNSVLYYKNLNNRLEYRLTLNSEPSFSPYWSPAFDGIILYSTQTGENINVNFIPDYGIIPKKNNADNQLRLSEKYVTEYDDPEKYLLSLERVYYFFSNSKDIDSRIYISRGLSAAALAYINAGDMDNSSRIRGILSGISGKESDYSSIMSSYLDNIINGRQGDKILSDAVSELSKNKKNKLLPFLLEDLGDEFARLNKNDEAVKIYTSIINEYPDFKRNTYIHLKIAELSYTSLQNDMSPSYLHVISSAYIYLRLEASKNIIKVFDKEKNIDRKIRVAEAMFKKYGEVRNTRDLFLYIAGKAYYDKGDFANAKPTLLKAMELSRNTTYIYYKINILLGLISEKEKNYSDMGRYFAAGAKNYALWFKEPDYKDNLNKLIDYYEIYGERADSGGNYSECVELYKGYVELIDYLHTRKMFTDIYNEYASRAHILYIDAYSKWKGGDYKELSKLEYDYNEKENNLKQARISFDKAHIYGLAYIYARMAASIMQQTSYAQNQDTAKSSFEQLLINSANSVEQIEWALFMDDAFIDAELLKGWIYQYIDLKRSESEESGNGDAGLFNKYFPESLWEKNISNYDRALEINDERQYPEREGNLNLNIANTYFLLENYPRAFTHYTETKKYKKYFSSKIQEALFYYHLGYCFWQNDDIERAREEMRKALIIYDSLSSGNRQKYKYQYYNLYRFFALFDRMEKKFNKAITWYKRVVDLSKKNDLEIDRARYMQETAFCYKELGDLKNALAYLDRSDRILKEYKISEKDYSLRFTLLGLFEFGFLDFGQDTYVIGNNRIDDELDTVQKRLLNESLKYEIYYEKGEFTKAINSLKRKIDILGSRKDRIYNETRVITLNNIGYCYFMLRDYERADSYFRQAWDFAVKQEDDLEGLFITIQNSANLFSFLLENDINSVQDPDTKIDSFINKINEYRSRYQETRYKKEMEDLKAKAAAQHREVKESELDNIKKIIEEEAREKYYSLDILTAIFEFRKADLLRNQIIYLKNNNGKTDNVPEQGFDYYKYNRNIFRLYESAISGFESAIKIAGNKQSKRQLIKLQLDLGKCRERTGSYDSSYDESYSTYLSAADNALKYEYDDLLWIVYSGIAALLSDHGKDIEGDDSLPLALDYYDKALKIIEPYPCLYSEEVNRINSLYENYAILLAASGNAQKAIDVSERGYEVRRLMLIARTSPEFYLEGDNSDFNDYINQVREAGKIKNEISVLLESGDTENAAVLKERLKAVTSGLNNFIENIRKNKPFFATFISLSGEALPKYNDAVIYKFIGSGGKVYAWKIDSGKLSFREFMPGGDKLSAAEAVAGFMQDGYTDKHRLVVFNKTAAGIFRDNQSNNNKFPSFMYIPSVERAGYYLKANSIAIDNILYNGTGLEKKIKDNRESGKITIAEGSFNDNDISEYSVLIDEKNELSPSVFFGKRLEPALIIKKLKNTEPESFLLLAESSLYSGIRTACFYVNNMTPEEIAGLCIDAAEKTFDKIFPEESGFIRIGFSGYDSGDRKQKLEEFAAGDLKKYGKYLSLGETDLAELYLKRWHKQITSEKDNALYLYNIAEIRFLKGNIRESISYLDKSLETFKNQTEIYNKAFSAKLFLLLYNNDFTAASGLLKENQNNNFITSMDYLVYSSVLNLAANDKTQDIEKIKDFNNHNSILPENKLNLLFAEYLYLSGRQNLAGLVLDKWTNDYNITDRDILKYVLIKGNKSKDFHVGRRTKEILSLEKNKDIENEAVLLSAVNGEYDTISVFPVYFAVTKFSKTLRSGTAINLISELNVDEMVKKSRPVDAAQLLNEIIKIYESEQKYGEALKYVTELNGLLRTMQMPFLLKKSAYEESVLLAKLQKHEESYNAALAGLSLPGNDDELYVKYQLLLVEEGLYLGNMSDAASRIKAIEPGIRKNEYKYVLYFLKARMEFINVLNNKKASGAQWAGIEKIILSGLDCLDSGPEVISRFNRTDLINEGLDFLISYKMSRNDVYGSLLYAEVKKQINLRSGYPGLVSNYALPENVLNSFKAIKGKKQSGQFDELMRKYPALQFAALANYIPVDLFRKKIKNNSAVLYVIKNINDILCWVMTNDSVIPVRLKNGYLQVKKILNKYDDILAVKNISRVSDELYEVFKPVEKYYKQKEDIIFITDNMTEKIPFEIIGAGTMLDESYNISYIPSIMYSFNDSRYPENSVHFADSDNKSIVNKLEFVSVRESGIRYDYSAEKPGIAHLNSEILFDSFKNEIYINGKIYRDIVKSDYIYIPDYNLRNISINDFAVMSSLNGVSGAIVNNAAIHDMNNAVFVDNFYMNFNNTKNLRSSFQSAKELLRKSRKFSSPAYWSGIRLYLGSI